MAPPPSVPPIPLRRPAPPPPPPTNQEPETTENTRESRLGAPMPGCGFELVFPFEAESEDHSRRPSKKAGPGKDRETKARAQCSEGVFHVQVHCLSGKIYLIEVVELREGGHFILTQTHSSSTYSSRLLRYVPPVWIGGGSNTEGFGGRCVLHPPPVLVGPMLYFRPGQAG